MAKYGIITNENEKEMDNIYTRLVNLERCIDLYNHCLEFDIWSENPIDLSALGQVIHDYSLTTKEKYKLLSKKLGTYT